MVLNPRAGFAVAHALHSDAGAPVGEVFSFVSGLYFRGKAVYSATFARPPESDTSALVISAGDGLISLAEAITAERLRRWADVEISERNPEFTEPLIQHAEALERAYGASTRFVLLGSIASNKYVGPLTRVFGDHLLFPTDFVGRGDMSRGALMLRAARAAIELPYEPVETAIRRGRRAPRIGSSN